MYMPSERAHIRNDYIDNLTIINYYQLLIDSLYYIY